MINPQMIPPGATPIVQPVAPPYVAATVPTNVPAAVQPYTVPGVPANVPVTATPGVPNPGQPYGAPNPLMYSFWRQKFPTCVSGLFCTLQCIVCIAIIGCEIGSMLIDIVTATIYVGLWSGLIFLCAWIAQAGATCCCRERGCATYTLIMQCISLLFAACVIGFDTYFIIYPTTCFFTTSTCLSTGTSRGLFYSVSNFNDIKMPLIKGQLAGGALMFVLCLVYIIIYIVTAVRVRQVENPSAIYPGMQSPYPLITPGADGMMNAPPVSNVRSQRAGSPLYHRPMMLVDHGDGRYNDLTCPSCSNTMAVTIRKKF